MTLHGKCVEPGTNKEMDMRETFTIVDDNTQLMTSYQTRDGKENKMMEIKFTRK